jgi:anti-sigma-K factor RskA
VNVEQIISSGLLESYVLGMTTEEETLMVRDMCTKHPELLNEIELIEESLIGFAPQHTPPLRKDLKEEIASKLTFNEEKPEPAIISLNAPVPGGNLNFYRVGIAASIALLIGCGMYIYSLQTRVAEVENQLADASASRTMLSVEMEAQKESMNKLAANFSVVSDPGMKAIPLSGMNSLASKSAMVHWNPSTQELYFNANALPASPDEKQYQLWAIVDGKPVDAGVISLENGVAFQKMKLVAGAKAFAVTIENRGGSASPTLDTMCLLGNV